MSTNASHDSPSQPVQGLLRPQVRRPVPARVINLRISDSPVLVQRALACGLKKSLNWGFRMRIAT